MCYELYPSTSSPEDLSRYNSQRIGFSHPDGADHRHETILENDHKWFVGAPTGCSCALRHLTDGDLGFGEPQDWFPEDGDDIEATAELYRVIASLVGGDNRVDCVDLWRNTESAEIKTLSVRLAEVSEKAFRLFENHHFVFEP